MSEPSDEPIPSLPSATVSGRDAPITEEMVELEIPFIAIDGSPASVTVDSGSMEEARKTVVLASCCPCMVGGVTSPQRVAELKNLLKRFTFWTVVLQIIMFIVSLCAGGGFASIDENPLIGPTVQGLVDCGAKYTYAIKSGGIHRLFIPVLLHANIFHIIANLWAELVVCMYAEHMLGPVRLGLIFVASGLGGSILSAIISPEAIGVGASGAVMGVMAVLFVNAVFEKETTDPLRLGMIRSLSIAIVITLFMSFAPHVDFAAHIGGLIVGACVGFYYWGAHGIKTLARYPKLQKFFPLIIAGVLALYFVIIVIVLAAGTTAIPLFGEDSQSSS